MADNAATQRRAADDLASGQGLAHTVKTLTATIELAAASAADTITFGRIPAGARIMLGSYANDDCATTGAPTLDLGLFAVDSNITDDDDCLNDGIDLANAGSGNILKDIADAGDTAWSIAGASSDPGGELIFRGTVKDAATNQTGTITVQLEYYLD